MTNLADVLADARRHHQAGNLPQAEQLCRQVLQTDPRHPGGLALLGLLAHQAGRNDLAVAYLGQSVALDPSDATAHFHLGAACHASGQLAEAVAAYQQALRLRPDLAEARHLLGNALRDQGRFGDAILCYREALGQRPQSADIHNNLGIALAQQGSLDEAAAAFRQAISQRPDYATAHGNLGLALAKQGRLDEAIASYQHSLRLDPSAVEVHNNLGTACRQLGRLDEAVAAFRQAVRLRPTQPEVHDNLGLALLQQGRHDEAAGSFRQALVLRPDTVETHLNLANALRNQMRFAEAADSLEQALRLRPDFTEAHNTLGIIRAQQGRLDDALECFRRSLELRPDAGDTHLNRAMVWVQQGNYEQGWPEYEWRWRCPHYRPRAFRQPPWDGGPLEGRTILLHAEQGLGDTLMFARYAALVNERGGRVVFECQAPLLRLLARTPGIDQLVVRDQPLPPFDVHAPLLSLPALLKTTLATVPANVPYVVPDPALVEHWRRELEAVPGFRIGISWQGSLTNASAPFRVIALAHFAPLARIEGVHFFSLQKGAGSEQLRDVAADWPITDLGPRLDEESGPFMDTAAVMKGLDLVISADTSLVHLAGALGVPAWVALWSPAEFRWMLHREDSPWYPTLRLFRQTTRGDWGSVIRRIAGDLRQRLAAQAGAVRVEVSPGELLDKISILEIKRARMTDAAKLRNVQTELSALQTVRDQTLPVSDEVAALARELMEVNTALWEVEDEIRLCERARDFGGRFVELARSVYHHNDRRSKVKRRINDLLQAGMVEEKAYPTYD